jgi:hypothetical protein
VDWTHLTHARILGRILWTFWFHKKREFLNQLNSYQFLMNYFFGVSFQYRLFFVAFIKDLENCALYSVQILWSRVSCFSCSLCSDVSVGTIVPRVWPLLWLGPWRPMGLWDVKGPTISRQLTDGGEIVSLTCQLCFTSQENSWFLFMLEAD